MLKASVDFDVDRDRWLDKLMLNWKWRVSSKYSMAKDGIELDEMEFASSDEESLPIFSNNKT